MHSAVTNSLKLSVFLDCLALSCAGVSCARDGGWVRHAIVTRELPTWRRAATHLEHARNLLVGHRRTQPLHAVAELADFNSAVAVLAMGESHTAGKRGSAAGCDGADVASGSGTPGKRPTTRPQAPRTVSKCLNVVRILSNMRCNARASAAAVREQRCHVACCERGWRQDGCGGVPGGDPGPTRRHATQNKPA